MSEKIPHQNQTIERTGTMDQMERLLESIKDHDAFVDWLTQDSKNFDFGSFPPTSQEQHNYSSVVELFSDLGDGESKLNEVTRKDFVITLLYIFSSLRVQNQETVFDKIVRSIYESDDPFCIPCTERIDKILFQDKRFADKLAILLTKHNQLQTKAHLAAFGQLSRETGLALLNESLIFPPQKGYKPFSTAYTVLANIEQFGLEPEEVLRELLANEAYSIIDWELYQESSYFRKLDPALLLRLIIEAPISSQNKKDRISLIHSVIDYNADPYSITFKQTNQTLPFELLQQVYNIFLEEHPYIIPMELKEDPGSR